MTFVRILSEDRSRTDIEWLFRTHPGSKQLGRVVFEYGEEEEGRIYADTRTSWLARMVSEFLVDDAICWFIHNKGATHFGRDNYQNVNDWRRMMMYFIFEKDWCVSALREDFYDVCGSNSRLNHFSGTMWMAHSRYMKTLPYAGKDSPQGNRFAGEFWIIGSLHIDHSRVLCVYNTEDTDLYGLPHPRITYEHASIGQNCPTSVKQEFVDFISSQPKVWWNLSHPHILIPFILEKKTFLIPTIKELFVSFDWYLINKFFEEYNCDFFSLNNF